MALPSAGQIEIRFRAQDANNYLQLTIDGSGNLDLDEVVAGIPAQLATSAAAVVAGGRVEVIAYGSTVRIHTLGSSGTLYTLKISTSASNFQTATAGEIETEGTGGDVRDLTSWPRLLEGAAKTELDRYGPSF